MIRPEERPRCYGRSWTHGDPECEDCDLEIDCRHIVQRRNSPYGTVPVRNVSGSVSTPSTAERSVGIMGGLGSVRSSPRHEGEPWWARLLKNFGLGALSRGGVEISLYCEDERQRPIVIRRGNDPEDDSE
jgi:hypothetical protein